MALSIEPTPPVPRAIYRYAGVRVDTVARRLWVDEIERRPQPLVFNLLWLLCEQPRQVIGRDALFQRLWPDGSYPSDESLSQTVFKLRSLLGPYGASVVTVRQVGLRLDADVAVSVADVAIRPEFSSELQSPDADLPRVLAANDIPAADGALTDHRGELQGVAAASAIAMPSLPGQVAPRADGGMRRRPRIAAAARVAAAVALLALALAAWTQQVVDPGFGLRVSDLRTWRPASIAAIAEALAADTRGERPRAVALMESVHAGDPDTPVPALFLATWWAAAGDARAGAMADSYRQRLGEHAPAYVHLLGTHLLAAVSLGAPVGTSQIDLLLAERPAARRLRLARAHWHLGEVQPDAALADLRAIAIDDLSDRAQVTALLDRIALGDVAAVAALIAPLPAPDAAASAARAQLLGWVALAGGDASAALGELAAGATRAADAGLVEPERRLQIAAAVAAGRLRDYAAVRVHLGRARVLALQQQRPLQAVQTGLLLLALPDRDAATRAVPAAELASQIPSGAIWECLDARLVYALTAVSGDPCPQETIPTTASLRGIGPVLAAYAAYNAGETDVARVQFDAAVADGAADGLLAAYVGILAQRLGRAGAAVDPGLQLSPLLGTQATAWWQALPPD